jgi:7-cyano-7-deazaguanine synthase in queuosine biosynthesis
MATFDFVQRTSQAAQARDQLSGTEYWVNDQSFVRAFGAAVAPAVADLVTVALSCYAADRLTRRSVDWSRRLHLRVALHQPERWILAAKALGSYLGTLTDDEWSFDFVGGRVPRLSEQQGTLFPVDLQGKGTVALFSGGLDSLAGAAYRLTTDPDRLVLLGARSSSVIGRDQHDIAARLRSRHGDRVIELGVPLELRRAWSTESSQRTRGFLFLSLATAAAVTANVDRVLVFENGYGAHNPRLAEHQFGSQATLATHPHLLGLFERLMAVLGIPVSVELPHRWLTKGQLLRLLPASAGDLIALTASCDSYPLRIAERTHCGRCGSCLLRQQSLIAAGLDHLDRQDYVRRPLERGIEADTTAMLMARQAWLFGQLGRIEDWAEIAWRWPSLVLGLDDASWEDRASVLKLMQATADEWRDLMAVRPYLRRHFRWSTTTKQATA